VSRQCTLGVLVERGAPSSGTSPQLSVRSRLSSLFFIPYKMSLRCPLDHASASPPPSHPRRLSPLLTALHCRSQEVLSGSLDWTPIHKDVAFWRENASKFEQQNHQVLRVLVKLMEVSREARTLAVACHDLSMFMQHHTHGKHIVQVSEWT
jgi:hypothetical protein